MPTSRFRAEKARNRARESSPPCSFSSETTLVRDSFQAGPRLNTSVLRTQKPSVAAMMRTSGVPSKVSGTGESGSSVATSRFTPQYASSSPNAPPSSDRISPSVSSWRTMRPRPPPSARRIAISLRRAVPRASIMLARFRHDTTSTMAAIAISRPNVLPNSSSVCGLVEIETRESLAAVRSWFLFSAGYSRSSCPDRILSDGAIPSGVSPGFRRPMTISPSLRRSASVFAAVSSRMKSFWTSSFAPIGTHTSGATSAEVPVNPRGAMPTMVYGRELRRIVLPSIDRSPPWLFQ